MIPGIGHSPTSSSSNLEDRVSSQPPFQVYQDSPVVPRHQIPVLPTPSSPEPEERFFPGQAPPSYESVMASGGGGAGGGGPDVELRQLGDKMMGGAVRLRSLLNLYKPSKHSPEVCRAKEEMWTDKIERCYLDFQVDLFKFKAYAENAGVAQDEYDDAVSDVTESVSQYTVEMTNRALSAMSISSSEDRHQTSGQNLSANSDSSTANERRKRIINNNKNIK